MAKLLPNFLFGCEMCLSYRQDEQLNGQGLGTQRSCPALVRGWLRGGLNLRGFDYGSAYLFEREQKGFVTHSQQGGWEGSRKVGKWSAGDGG